MSEGPAGEALAGVAIADLDRAPEALPVEEVERLERRRNEEVALQAALERGRRAVHHAGPPENPQDVRAAAGAAAEQIPNRRSLGRVDVRREGAVHPAIDAD